MSDAMLGYGITYEISTTTGGSTYTELDEVFDIEMASDEVDDVDVTHYGSPNRTRETIAGVITKGEGSLSINWVPGSATDLLLRGLLVSGEVRTHKITFPNGVEVSFPAYVKGRAPSLPVDGRLEAQFTVKVAGAETWVAAP